MRKWLPHFVNAAYIYKRDVSEAINVYPIYFADSGYVIGWPSRAAPAANIAQGAYSYLDASFDTGGIKHKLTAGVSIDRLRVRQHVTAYAYASNSPAYSDPNDLMSWAKPDSLAEQDWGARYTASTSRNLNIILGDDITFSDKLNALIGVNRTNMVTKSYTVAGDVTGYDKTVVTPTASLIFKPTANVTTYASYMEGLESGSVTPNEPSYAEPGKILDPFVSRQYEVGAKFAPREGLLITAALFRIEKANSYEDVTSSGQLTITQDGLQIHQGLELTLSGKVTDRLTLIAGGTLMDAKVRKADNPALEGKKPTDVSNRLAKIFAQYEIPGISGLSLSGGAFYAGPTYKDAANLQKIDGYLVFDLGAHLKTTIVDHPVSFNLNVANLTNKSYWASMYVIGLPRNIAFSVRTSF
ncbi:TonB-dependent siderophore receptor [Sphingobium sp.]|uniref:TonB-dependent receptor n=1 Tax=Sphingobium sp. TaxID=1912891 RepID=UPI0025F672F5|nr:TonB-dependent receptor [Sphingobium sp.]